MNFVIISLLAIFISIYDQIYSKFSTLPQIQSKLFKSLKFYKIEDSFADNVIFVSKKCFENSIRTSTLFLDPLEKIGIYESFKDNKILRVEFVGGYNASKRTRAIFDVNSLTTNVHHIF
jgi:hypothetical protein